MPSLMAGTDEVICRAMGVERRSLLAKRGQPIKPVPQAKAQALLRNLYQCIASNFPGQVRSPTEKLWQCRQATDLTDRNCNPETLLEKAVANLARAGHMPGWFNQCPVATGLVDPHADRGRRIDLVHLDGEKVRLVELKWDSDTPASALFQVVEYGLAWLFAWLRKDELGLADRPVMSLPKISLEVLAPCVYYSDGSHRELIESIHHALGAFVGQETKGAASMSLIALSFPKAFTEVPFNDGQDVKTQCRSATLTPAGRAVRDAFSRAASADDLGGPATTQGLPMRRFLNWFGTGGLSERRAADEALGEERFLPGVPAARVEEILARAAGNEIALGKFDHPESSAALAANALGYFLNRAADLPPIPGLDHAGWPARSVMLEANVRFPWKGGRHPWLDALVTTRRALIGIESKRYEPFRKKHAPKAHFSDAYWRPVWGDRMSGYQDVREALSEDPNLYSHLDAAQLIKHAFALRTEAHRNHPHRELKPFLLYLYAEPEWWAGSLGRVDEQAKLRHRREITDFSSRVSSDEVAFVSCSYRQLLEAWSNANDKGVRAHAAAVAERFVP
ncbi:MAG: hypothetical protein F4X81_04635 [Gammaproteobacteria bacterium]|nr:hypothetical protein [Gammaproteobacteria bacterium]MYE50733.1 hypothetical protein [Gammaproteobacteria bacterium]